MLTTYIVPDGLRRPRADKVLAVAFPDHSRVAFQRAFDAGLVKRNGEPLSRDSTLEAGDEIAFLFPEIKPNNMTPADIPLDVIFEDQHLLVVNKTSGMVVHPGAATGEDTLVLCESCNYAANQQIATVKKPEPAAEERFFI